MFIFLHYRFMIQKIGKKSYFILFYNKINMLRRCWSWCLHSSIFHYRWHNELKDRRYPLKWRYDQARIDWSRKFIITVTEKIYCYIHTYLLSFTLFPAHSRVGRGNLVLRHSVAHFPPNSGGIACWVAELNAALCLDTRAKKWKYKWKKYFTSSSGDRLGFKCKRSVY